MYILKNNKLPKFHLKFNGYRLVRRYIWEREKN